MHVKFLTLIIIILLYEAKSFFVSVKSLTCLIGNFIVIVWNVLIIIVCLDLSPSTVIAMPS